MADCVRCNKEASWDEVLEQYMDLINRADSYGYEALTEDQQALLMGFLCVLCYRKSVNKEV